MQYAKKMKIAKPWQGYALFEGLPIFSAFSFYSFWSTLSTTNKVPSTSIIFKRGQTQLLTEIIFTDKH